MRLAQDRSPAASMPLARCCPVDTRVLYRSREILALAGPARRATKPGAHTRRESRNFLRLVLARGVQDARDVESLEAAKL